MSGAKPVAGFTSRTEFILHHRKDGKTRGWIAEQLGIPVKSVSALECSGRRFRRTLPDFVRPSAGSFPPDVRRMLRPAAARRDLSVDELIRRLIETIALEGLADAVLDDGLVAS